VGLDSNPQLARFFIKSNDGVGAYGTDIFARNRDSNKKKQCPKKDKTFSHDTLLSKALSFFITGLFQGQQFPFYSPFSLTKAEF
jgi:hypothetical protein